MLEVKTITELNDLLGGATLHPQVSLLRLDAADTPKAPLRLGFFAVLLAEDCCCPSCGRKDYDFSNATMLFLQPGDTVGKSTDNPLPEQGWLLAFHPDALVEASQGKHIGQYNFFNYRRRESLHLSRREKAIVMRCLESIGDELQCDIDRHSVTILLRHVELLLDYCTRFYERQFITREDCLVATMQRLEGFLDSCTAFDAQGKEVVLSLSNAAHALGLSSAYLADIVRFQTGLGFDDYAARLRAEKAQALVPQSVGCC